MTSEQDLREFMCELGRRLHARNLVAATDGNISVRIAEDRYLCTPSGVSKGFMKPEEMLIADGSGEKVEGEGKVTTEIFTHLAAYEERPDVHAVIHAHPPVAVALTLAGVSMEEPVLPELVGALGGIVTTPYATPGTPEGGDVIREAIRECDGVMLDRHGAVTVGPNLLNAYYKMEKIEHSAQCLWSAHLLGTVKKLDPDQVEKLYGVWGDYGGKGKLYKYRP